MSAAVRIVGELQHFIAVELAEGTAPADVAQAFLSMTVVGARQSGLTLDEARALLDMFWRIDERVELDEHAPSPIDWRLLG